MIYPKLVPDSVCKTPIHIVIEEEGLKCNWQDSAKTVLTGQQKYVRITGKALFNGDICPNVPVISSGYGIIFGERREICEGIKNRNPDGTVNYTEVRFQ